MEQLGQNPATRSGGTRSVVAFTAIMVLGLTLVLSPLIVWLWPSKKEAVATYRPTVEVQDEAGVLDSTVLSDKLKNLEFRKQVHLAVLTVPGEDVSNSTTLCWSMPVRMRATLMFRGSRRRTPSTGVTAW